MDLDKKTGIKSKGTKAIFGATKYNIASADACIDKSGGDGYIPAA